MDRLFYFAGRSFPFLTHKNDWQFMTKLKGLPIDVSFLICFLEKKSFNEEMKP
jgi:hypothetical protein